MKIKLIMLTISNIFMLNVASLFGVLGMKNIVKAIVNQAIKNTDFIESMIGGK